MPKERERERKKKHSEFKFSVGKSTANTNDHDDNDDGDDDDDDGTAYPREFVHLKTSPLEHTQTTQIQSHSYVVYRKKKDARPSI